MTRNTTLAQFYIFKCRTVFTTNKLDVGQSLLASYRQCYKLICFTPGFSGPSNDSINFNTWSNTKKKTLNCHKINRDYFQKQHKLKDLCNRAFSCCVWSRNSICRCFLHKICVSVRYHSSSAPHLPLSYYCYNQKDKRTKPGKQRCSFRYRGRWTGEYFHGATGQTCKSALSCAKFIQSGKRVHDYMWK